jgi:hypothetical protein
MIMQNNWIEFIILGAITAATAVFALYSSIKALLVYRKVRASKSWTEIVGTITFVGIDESTIGRYGGKTYYPFFEYSYSVLGTMYKGAYKWNWGSGENAAEKRAAEHPIGSTIAVRYNPRKPQEAVTQYYKVDTTALNLSVVILILEFVFLYILSK